MRHIAPLVFALVLTFWLGCTKTGTRYEAERFVEEVGKARIESGPGASGGQAVHIGADSAEPSAGVGNALVYEITARPPMEMAVLELHYADDVAGTMLAVKVDGVLKGTIRTEGTGGWDRFVLDTQKVDLGVISDGKHTVRFEVVRGGSYGALLDFFDLVDPSGRSTRTSRAYGYLKDLADTRTGLVASTHYDAEFTTLYKSALAAIAFLHEGDVALAERIFGFYLARYRPESFDGFNQVWSHLTGLEGERNRWAGDNCFLLLALTYFREKTGSFGRYRPMVDGLVRWLVEQADDDQIVAEGLANIYAALKPFEASVPGVPAALEKVRSGFFATKNYANVLDHIERGALVFSDLSGFASVPRFRRRETWDYNGSVVETLAGFAGDDFGNVEISAQILLAAKIWRSELAFDSSWLETEMNKLWLLSGRSPGVVNAGLPYFVTRGAHGWEGSSDEPIIDPTCYMLFFEWGLNPMAPGRKGY